MIRRARSLLVAGLAVIGVLAMIVVAPAPAANAAASTATITTIGQTGFSAEIALGAQVGGKWEYRLRYLNLATNATDQRSVTLDNSVGWTGATLSMTGLPLGNYRVWVEERQWGVESTRFDLVTETRYLGYRAPTGVAAAPLAAGVVRLTWTPPAVIAPGTGYRVKWRALGSATWTPVNIGGGTTAQADVGGLVDGQDYVFTVTTIVAGVEHETSEAVSGRPIGLPAAPANATPVPLNGGAIWSPTFVSTDAAPSDPASALFDLAPAGTTDWVRVAPIRTGSSWTFSGLVNGTPYALRARAVNRIGESATVETAITPIAAPAAPVLGSVARTPDSISIVADFGGTVAAPVTSTFWQLGTVGPSGTSWTPVFPATSGAGRYTVSGLTTGVEYRLRAASTNQVGLSAWSESGAVRTIDRPSRAVIGTTTRVDGGVTAVVDFRSMPARPSLGADAVWEVSTDSGGSWRVVPATGAADTWTVTGLENGVAQRIRVTAANEIGEAPASAWVLVTPVAAPAAPALGAITRADSSARIDVTVPSSAAAPVASTSWQLAAVTDGSGDAWTDVVPTSDGGSILFDGLESGTTYRVRVRASNDVGASAWTQSSAFLAVGAPTPPTAPVVTPKSSGADLTVDFPSTDGRPADEADAIWQVARAADPDDWSTAQVVAVSAGGFVLAGLQNGTDYLLRVASTNAYGVSAWTSPAAFRPIAAPTTPAIGRVIPGDGRLSIEAVLPDTAAAPLAGAVWQIAAVHFAPATAAGEGSPNGPATQGKLRSGAAIAAPPYGWVTSIGSWSDATPTIVGGRYVFSGLTNGAAYSVRVVATNPTGSTVSTNSEPTTPVSSPVAPIIVAAEPGIAALTVRLAATSSVDRPVVAVGWQVAATSGPGAGVWRSVGAEELAGNVFRLGGLTSDQGYTVRVRAANGTGTSAWVTTAGSIAPLRPPVAAAPTAEPAPPSAAPEEPLIELVTTVTSTGTSVLVTRGTTASMGSAAATAAASAETRSGARTNTVTVSGGTSSVTDSGTIAAAAAPDAAAAQPAPAAATAPTEVLAGGAGLLGLLGMLGAAIRWYLKARKRLAAAEATASSRPAANGPQSYRMV
ncbi:fibronectin type III domain-containing protein [Herbiconiux sp. L3-i23]|uniref:fibronectin type III domain-containing protein n=1 Tax=Herbiconiux sp. L3-i23 TaxID=2905871 RepID=UPI00204D3D6A|nr:fibronectin type III domain-containing protein [Herbiconiux sp. L3-i23]BDI24139.1 hypothetical protein L3i23_29150 [Herbiconiux sp. L3-i23]